MRCTVGRGERALCSAGQNGTGGRDAFKLFDLVKNNVAKEWAAVDRESLSVGV